MEKRVTNVKAHTRQGHAVQAHPRVVEGQPGDADKRATGPDRNSLQGLSDEKATVWETEDSEIWVERTSDNDEGPLMMRRVFDPHNRPAAIIVRSETSEATVVGGLPASENPTVNNILMFQSVNYSYMNLQGYTFNARQAIYLDFSDANLDDASFFNRRPTRGGYLRSEIILNRCIFDGASLRNADFRGASLHGSSFIGADVTGVDFSDTRVAMGPVDFTDSTLTGEQYDSFWEGANGVTYRHYSLTDAAAELGLDKDEVAIMAWAGELEIRDATGAVVTGEFDASKHHVPEWAVREARERRSTTSTHPETG